MYYWIEENCLQICVDCTYHNIQWTHKSLQSTGSITKTKNKKDIAKQVKEKISRNSHSKSLVFRFDVKTGCILYDVLCCFFRHLIIVGINYFLFFWFCPGDHFFFILRSQEKEIISVGIWQEKIAKQVFLRWEDWKLGRGGLRLRNTLKSVSVCVCVPVHGWLVRTFDS